MTKELTKGRVYLDIWFQREVSITIERAARSRLRSWSGMLSTFFLNHKQGADRALGMAQCFETSRYTPSDILSPSRPPLLNLPKQYHKPGTKYSFSFKPLQLPRKYSDPL